MLVQAHLTRYFQFIIMVCEATDNLRNAICTTKMIGKLIYLTDEEYS